MPFVHTVSEVQEVVDDLLTALASDMKRAPRVAISVLVRPELQDEVSIADLLSPKSRKWEDLRAAQSSGYVSLEPSISETVPLAVSRPECSSERSRLLRPSIPNNRGMAGYYVTILSILSSPILSPSQSSYCHYCGLWKRRSVVRIRTK